jgi:hypothetical protein
MKPLGCSPTVQFRKQRKEKKMSNLNRNNEEKVVTELEFCVGVGMSVMDDLMYKVEHLQEILYDQNMMPPAMAKWVNQSICNGAMWLGEGHSLCGENESAEDAYTQALTRLRKRMADANSPGSEK